MNVHAGQIPLRDVTLDDKYEVARGQVYLTGLQALVKLPLLQRELDRRAGLNTAGFITGYRGSPLGGYDQQLWRASRFLDQNNIRFLPGVNEELAATAVWGTQQLAFEPGRNVDGVFAIWYGKNPGVDRAMDALRHGNTSGSSKHGGVLLLGGDDHPGRSASVPNQSELDFISAAIPVLNPSDIADYLRLGLHGIALSRYSGCWAGMIVLAETVDGAASIAVDLEQLQPVIPFGDNADRTIRWPDPHKAAEARLHERKLPAVLDYARVNMLNRQIFGSKQARLGVVTTGKAYLDVCQALNDLGLSYQEAASLGLSLIKVDLIWPLEPTSMRAFCESLEEVLVVEEKRPTVEPQLKDIFYNEPRRPRIIGKTSGPSLWEAQPEQVLFQVKGELSPTIIARAIASRLMAIGVDTAVAERLKTRLATIDEKEREAARPRLQMATQNSAAILTQGGRTPSFCSGCPHNTSTRVPDGSRALAGIGCHFMAQWIYPEQTAPFTQMGSEGAAWVGQAAFTDTQHMFVNLGDGTFYHSGLLAIRQSIAAKVNVTYKILYNDAVAMTGGQPVDGTLPVPSIATVLLAEGCRRVAVVSDEPDKYVGHLALPNDVRSYHRDALDDVQRDFRQIPGCTAIIYDQTCAAEKRRRRKIGTFPDPARRVVINPEVCEGCGDCNKASNCLSIVPLETELGRKRAIDQSSCNKDFRCIEGFCPSFVTVEGGRLRKGKAQAINHDDLPPPPAFESSINTRFDILVTGVGGSGVVTVGALLGMAAHLEGRSVSVLDMTGLAQKGGAVLSHVRIAGSGTDRYAARIRSADLLLGCDITTTLEPEALAAFERTKTHAIVTRTEAQTGAFAKDPDLPSAIDSSIAELQKRLGSPAVDVINAAEIAQALLGDTIQANLILLGYAWQRGRLPLSLAAIMRAIELNGVAIEAAKQAFSWGRVYAAEPGRVVVRMPQRAMVKPRDLREMVEYRSRLLVSYQDQSLAQRYKNLVARVEASELARLPKAIGLAEAVAANYYRVLAIKDEYEVARLHSDGRFAQMLEEMFEGDYRMVHHLAPPALARRDSRSGLLKKRAFGPWVQLAFGLLASVRTIRNSWLDPFARTPERQMERATIERYEQSVALVETHLSSTNADACLRLLSWPDQVRGYGHVRKAAFERAEGEVHRLEGLILKTELSTQKR